MMGKSNNTIKQPRWPLEVKLEALELYKTFLAKVVAKRLTEKYERELTPRL